MINTQALIGTMLGNCTLKKLLGQGEKGAVFLALQASPQRQVAVRVLPLATSQAPDHQTVSLEKFRQEMAVVSALKHEHIMSIYEYGEHEGQAYLVMRYIRGGTLRDVMEKEGPLALSRVITYLDQMAAALDYAHEQGTVHRDLRPTNILLTSKGRLLVSDFGLAQIAGERQTSKMPSLKPGTPVEALEYMAPEQVMGDVVDARADLFALGVMLYRMVTGKTPFQGATPLQMTTQLVQEEPASPCLLRVELPDAAEQVILRALAKRPQDRYARAQDFADAFRAALPPADTQADSSPVEEPEADSPAGDQPAYETPTAMRAFSSRSRGLFDPCWQKTEEEIAASGATLSELSTLPAARTTPLLSTRLRPGFKANQLRPIAVDRTDIPATMVATSDKAESALTGELTLARENLVAIPTVPDPVSPFPAANGSGTLSMPQRKEGITDALSRATPLTSDMPSVAKLSASQPLSPIPGTQVTGALMAPSGEQGVTSTIKLKGAVKVVQVPIAGQPGRYITGLLPVEAQTKQPEESAATGQGEEQQGRPGRRQKLFVAVLLVLLVFSSLGTVLYLHSRTSLTSKTGVGLEQVTPDLQAIGAAQATATATANIILSDPLQQNFHNWPVSSQGSKIYMFENGAYHITDNDSKESAPALLPDVNWQVPAAYTLTMDEIRGDDSSINNSFGMILCFNAHRVGSKTIIGFYIFEVMNRRGGEYQFMRYDNSKGPSSNPWKTVWHHPFGNEFHQGQGPKNTNTFKVFADGKNFTFTVNGEKVGAAQDGTLTSGEIGMLVNLKGTEVAFSDLLLTHS